MLSIECHCPSSQKYKRFVYAQGVSLIFTANPSARCILVAPVENPGFQFSRKLHEMKNWTTRRVSQWAGNPSVWNVTFSFCVKERQMSFNYELKSCSPCKIFPSKLVEGWWGGGLLRKGGGGIGRGPLNVLWKITGDFFFLSPTTECVYFQ